MHLGDERMHRPTESILALCIVITSCAVFPILADQFMIGFITAMQTAKLTYKIKLPTNRSVQLSQTHQQFAGAIGYAIDSINKNWKNLGFLGLENHTLNFTFRDHKFDTAEAIYHVVSLYHENVTAIIGPQDSCMFEAKVADALNLTMVAYACADSKLSNKKEYRTFSRVLPPASKVSKSAIALMKEYSWSKYTLVYNDGAKWTETVATMSKLSKDHNITIISQKDFSRDWMSMSKNRPMDDIVEATKKITRVYLMIGEHEDCIEMALAMRRANLIPGDGDYVLVAVDSKTFYTNNVQEHLYNWIERAKMKRAESVKNKTRVEDERHLAFQNVLLLKPRPPKGNQYEELINKTQEYLRDCSLWTLCNISHKIDKTNAIHVYDAVHVYAKALSQVLLQGGSPHDGISVSKAIRNTTFLSVQGYTIPINEDGDAEGNYSTLAMKKDANGEWGLAEVGDFLKVEGHGSKDLGVKYIESNVSKMDWVSGKPPKDEPFCGFDGANCHENFGTIIPYSIAMCSICAAVFIIATVFFCRHYLYEQKLAKLLWKVDFKDILVTNTLDDTAASGKMKRKVYNQYSFLSNGDVTDTTRTTRPAYTKIGSYKGTIVAIKYLRKKHVEINRVIKKELQIMKEMTHDNLIRFLGACVDHPHICILNQYCARGSLRDILENDDIYLDDMFIASLIADLIRGMIYLHDSEIVSHGNLRSSTCLVDSRWVVQISGFGLHNFNAPCGTEFKGVNYRKSLYQAPELLRLANPPKCGTQKGDVYSFSIIIYELIGRKWPWGEKDLPLTEIIRKVKYPLDSRDVFRPNLCEINAEEFVTTCIEDCWCEDPDCRPDFKYIRMRLKQMQQGLSSNIFDNMVALMEKYATNLETLVEERTQQLLEEKKKTDALLHRMLPKSVAEQLKRRRPVVPEHYDCVTIYFSDVVGFTALSAQSKPIEVVDLLNDLYSLFDSIIGNYDVYKVETIGDAYMVVSGLPIRNDDRHAGEIASMSLHLLSAIKTFKIRHRPEETLKLRIGIHSGPCVAGVVGLKMPRYCLFGDTVNTTSRMESTGEELRIHMSNTTKIILDKLCGFQLEERGLTPMKGKGEMLTWFLVGEDQKNKLKRISNEALRGRDNMSRQNNLNRQGSTASLLSKNISDDDDGSEVFPCTWLLNGGIPNGALSGSSNEFLV